MKRILALIPFISFFAGYSQVPVLVKDIATDFVYPDSDPKSFTEFNGKTFFVAYNSSGNELWYSNGTNSGTQMLKDVNASGGSDPIILGVAGNKLFFSAYNSTYGREIWVTDGTSAGTTILKDIAPGANSSSPGLLAEASNKFYFRANEGSQQEAWVTDGTGNGTFKVTDLAATQSTIGTALGTSAGELYFNVRMPSPTYRNNLFYSDGTATGAVNLTQNVIQTYPSSQMNVSELFEFNGQIFFDFSDDAEGEELWTTDGTVSGTYRFKALDPTSGGYPDSFFQFGNKFVFSANNGTGGVQKLWVSDGTSNGTICLEVFCVLSDYAILNNELYFEGASTLSGGSGYELYKTDGTLNGTSMVKDIYPGQNSSGVGGFTVVNGKIVFVAVDGTNGAEAWATDGTQGGTILLKDIYVGNSNAYILSFTVFGSKVYFTARKAFNDFYLYETDGTVSGTKEIMPTDATNTSNTMGQPGSTVYPPAPLYVTSNMLLFRGNFHNVGRELYGIGVPTSIKSIRTEGNFSVYPNPCSTKKLTLSMDDRGMKKVISIFDLAGRCVVNNIVTYEANFVLSLPEQMPGGTYLVYIESHGRIRSEQLIIN